MDYFKRFGFKTISKEDVKEKFAAMENHQIDPTKFPYIMELDVEEFFNNRQCHC